jgi:hypothetical protein
MKTEELKLRPCFGVAKRGFCLAEFIAFAISCACKNAARIAGSISNSEPNKVPDDDEELEIKAEFIASKSPAQKIVSDLNQKSARK